MGRLNGGILGERKFSVLCLWMIPKRNLLFQSIFLSPLGERQTLSSSILHITPMETPIIQNRDPLRAPLYIYYKAKIKTILWKLKIIRNICLSLSQGVTWSSSTNSCRQFHARWWNGWDQGDAQGGCRLRGVGLVPGHLAGAWQLCSGEKWHTGKIRTMGQSKGS